MHFLLAGLSIILIDLLLAGDNALVIALAVRSLPERQRRTSIICGAGAAVALRVALTAVGARLVTVEYLQIACGLLILGIALKVVSDAAAATGGFWQAILYIAAADLTMSADNVPAIAGASNGNIWLIVCGLALSIPCVVLGSTLLSRLMDRYAWITCLPSGLLGKAGGELILTDPLVARLWHPSEWHRYAAVAVLVGAVIVTGKLVRRRQING